MMPSLPSMVALNAPDCASPRESGVDDDDDAYWARTCARQPFFVEGLTYEDYAPAFRLGRARFRDDTLFDDVSARLASEWEHVRAGSRLNWIGAQPAVRAAWERADRSARGTVTIRAATSDTAASHECAR